MSLKFIILSALLVSAPTFSAETEIPVLSKSELKEIKFLDAHPAKFAGKLSSKSGAVRALAAALAFKTDQKKYQPELYKSFSINDYAERAKGNYNILTMEKALTPVKEIEAKNPGVPDKSYYMLLAFLHYREKNVWMEMPKEKTSMARFFRSSFFGYIFKGTDIPTVKVAWEIDAETQKQKK